MEDLFQRQSDLETCEMCETAEIRFAHTLEHDDYPDTLTVGCICAERMEEDYVSPRLREKKLITENKRRAAWNNRRWRIFERKNLYTNAGAFNIVIFPSAAGHKLRIKNTWSGAERYSTQSFPTKENAMQAAYDALKWANKNLLAEQEYSEG
jgi:hypothetical protein